MKDQVYATAVGDIADLRNKITNAVGNATQIMLLVTMHTLVVRLEGGVYKGWAHQVIFNLRGVKRRRC